MKNIRDTILELMTTDDSYNERVDNTIVRLYNKLEENEKSKFDRIFINLTGYSLTTIIKGETHAN